MKTHEVPPRVRALVALLLGAAAGVATADVEKRPGAPAVVPQAPAKNEDPAVRRLALRLADWEKAEGRMTVDGLTARAFIAPDALAYRIASTYVRLRRGGMMHGPAITRLRASLPRWKRYDGRSLLRVSLHNSKFEIGKKDRRVYTQTRNLTRDAIVVRAGKKTRLGTKLGGSPANLRVASLRVKKFWTTADGFTRRFTPRRERGRLVRDPASIGRKAVLSRPVKALVLEDKPAEVELLLTRKHLEKRGRTAVGLELHGWKTYEGPWKGDVIDLNERREWKELGTFALKVPLPPGGLVVSPEIRAIVEQVRMPAR